MDDREQYIALHKLLEDESGKRERWVRETAAKVVAELLRTNRQSINIDLTLMIQAKYLPNGGAPAAPVSWLDYTVQIAPISILRYYPWEATLVVEEILRGELEKRDDTHNKGSDSHRQQALKPPAET
jgi:hypothetical protein